MVYIVLSGIDLLYIGRSGKINSDGSLFIRKGGIKDRIVNGKQFDSARRLSWPKKMNEQNIEELTISWFITYSLKNKDCPKTVEGFLLKQYAFEKNRLPTWNKNP